MRIATWNVERLRHHRNLSEIIDACNQAKADILILTETDSQVEPDYSFAYRIPYRRRVSLDKARIYVSNEVGMEYREVEYSE